MVRAEKIIRGYAEDSQGLEIDNALIRLANHIISIVPKETIILPKMDQRQACAEGKHFLTEHFILHDIKYRPEEEMETFCSQEHTKREILDFIQNTKEISPFKLPIRLNKDFCNTKIHEYLMCLEDEDLLKQIEVIFNHIDLEVATSLTPHNYIHEIVHSQLNSRKGSIGDPNNQEVLSIFLELVSILEKESFENLLEYKLMYYYSQIYCYIDTLYDYIGNDKTEVTAEDYEKATRYAVSTLKALRLFRIYQNNPKMRKLIFKSIQSIFDNKTTVEQLLKVSGVNMQDEIRFIIKL